ncbi:SHOCT domain-containing protein [Paenarthrobacter sp. C1]|uniref:SHOCT domain-containing protein n=1 Tax=Paenarthrobacter sp. C1 TaxID=3400220 RepID=UPI003BF48287
MALGVVLGYSVPVGPNCSGAFTSQISAAGYDIAKATATGIKSNYMEQCQFAAAQQSGIYWGIMAFGAAIVILGLVLRSVLGRRPATPSAGAGVADELERLAALMDRGLLTHEEFATQKAKLLEHRA